MFCRKVHRKAFPSQCAKCQTLPGRWLAHSCQIIFQMKHRHSMFFFHLWREISFHRKNVRLSLLLVELLTVTPRLQIQAWKKRTEFGFGDGLLNTMVDLITHEFNILPSRCNTFPFLLNSFKHWMNYSTQDKVTTWKPLLSRRTECTLYTDTKDIT